MENERKSIDGSEEIKETTAMLSAIAEELNKLREQCKVVITQIETLMEQNRKNMIANYQEQLNILIEERDSLYVSISDKMRAYESLESIIKQAQEQKQSAVLHQIEKLLNIEIKDSEETTVIENAFGKFLKDEIKDVSKLLEEQKNIIKKLEELYYNGQLDLTSYQEMKNAINTEYAKFVKKSQAVAKKEIERKTQSTPTNDQAQNSSDKEEEPNPSPEAVDPIDSFDRTRTEYGRSKITSEQMQEELDSLFKGLFDDEPQPFKRETVERPRRRY